MMRPTRCVESFASRVPASLLLAGVAFPPVAGDSIAGAGEPFLVASELFQRFRGEELRAIAGGMTERFQQARRDEHGNFLRFKSEKPRRLGCVESCGNNLPTEKLRMLRSHVHTLMAARRLGRGEWAWVCLAEFRGLGIAGAAAATRSLLTGLRVDWAADDACLNARS